MSLLITSERERLQVLVHSVVIVLSQAVSGINVGRTGPTCHTIPVEVVQSTPWSLPDQTGGVRGQDKCGLLRGAGRRMPGSGIGGQLRNQRLSSHQRGEENGVGRGGDN